MKNQEKTKELGSLYAQLRLAKKDRDNDLVKKIFSKINKLK